MRVWGWNPTKMISSLIMVRINHKSFVFRRIHKSNIMMMCIHSRKISVPTYHLRISPSKSNTNLIKISNIIQLRKMKQPKRPQKHIKHNLNNPSIKLRQSAISHKKTRRSKITTKKQSSLATSAKIKDWITIIWWGAF